MVDVSGCPTQTFIEGGHTYYECLETIDAEDDMGLADPWLMQDMPWTALCSDWMMQTLDPHPFGSTLRQERGEHVICSANAQNVPFGRPEANIGTVLETEMERKEEMQVSDNGFYDMLMSPMALLAAAIPREGVFPVIYDTGATLAVTGISEDFIGNGRV
jgi:hypothetical protein